MTEHSTTPHGENLRNAIRWLSEQYLYQPSITDETHLRDIIEAASVKYDLTPLEEDFLMRKFLKKVDPSAQ
jgi:hypothetical protein